MRHNDKPIANALVVLREEFDNWAILFDPDSGSAFGLNPIGVFVWKRLDGNRTIQDITKELQKGYRNLPKEAKHHVKEFIQDLIEKGFAEYKTKEV